MAKRMKGLKFSDLTIQEKLCIKDHVIKQNGKRAHFKKPNECHKLNEIQIWCILSNYKDLLK